MADSFSKEIYDKESSHAVVLPSNEGNGHASAEVHGDKALDLLANAQHVDLAEVDPAKLKKLVRKIDLYIMPCMMLCEFFNFLDKSAISYSRLFGITTQNGLVGQQFAWLGSLFYIGYLIWQPCAAWLLVRIPVRWHLSTVVVIWGIVLGCTAACHNFAGLATCRFLLGMAESAMVPILGAVTGMWYTREEQATRVGLWFGSVGMSQIIGGLISYGMFRLESSGVAVAKWKFIFVLLGPVTGVFGLVLFVLIPSSPASAWWLTPEERLLALERIRQNKTGTAASEYKMSQFWEAWRDPRIYLCAISVFGASVPNGSISSFGATIIADFGYTTKQTTLLGMSTGASETVAMIAGILLSRRMKQRGLPAVICIGVSIVGAIMMIAIPAAQKNARFAGYCLVFWFPVGQMLFIPWFQSMIAGHTKRATFFALYQVFYSAGNLAGAQLYPAKDAPGYVPAKVTMIVMLCLHAATMGGLVLVHKRWNAKRAQEAELETEELDNIEFMDRTDWEIKSFRYPL
ncbi:hypothetical protein IAR55_002601 [Kwoniella newhampshirensis]|uniref:Major facilitator superfamily (MFS) profile domain-containing protein n=1 Tax=Kwoniella newhampshirensis TaxID=1651941 RepID=A0AAW0Z1X2_9TREE